MKRRIVSLIALLSIILALCGCTGGKNDSYFRITFIDVGQGDSALIECDGEYMLIDAGTKASGKTVVNALKDREEPITHLDVLVASHLHEDHIGGMIEVLEYLDLHKEGNKIRYVLSNSEQGKSEVASDFLERMKNSITIPEVGESYKLGSANVEVIYNSNTSDNDSLVLLVTYQETTFLLTGDIQKEAQSIVASKLREKADILKRKTNLIKMPHHGAYNSDPFLPNNASDNSLATLVSAAHTDYFVISVGRDNSYKHPDYRTLEIISQALKAQNHDEMKHLYRTDKRGNIVVTVMPNGHDLNITTSR